jgi:hypothetical protein
VLHFFSEGFEMFDFNPMGLITDLLAKNEPFIISQDTSDEKVKDLVASPFLCSKLLEHVQVTLTATR